jgi:predicted ATP-grasp superfamily ATP-dependent carboligase
MLTADAAYGPLQGTLPEALTYVRDPIWLQKILRTANLPALEIRDQETPPNPDGTWVQKPIKSAGGRSIRIWDETAFRFPLKEPHYFQQRVAGIGLSCILRIDQGQVHWCGASRELATSSRSRAPTHFAYCGSISLDESFTSKNGFDLARLRGRSIEIAKLLVEQTSGLNGLIGIDLLFDNDEFWVLEVNPRYTASVEVLELATGKSLLNFQADSRELQIPRHRSLTPTISAKQILYAERSIVVPDLSQYWAGDDPWKSPFLADIPVPNSMVEESWPICTVLADGLTPEIVEAKLHERITVVRKALFPT